MTNRGTNDNGHAREDDLTAVALAYNPGDDAPKILAAGKGHVAQRIMDEAEANDIPFYKDSQLAETLSKLQIGDTIPPELYEVVAQILVFVDGMDRVRSKLDASGFYGR